MPDLPELQPRPTDEKPRKADEPKLRAEQALQEMDGLLEQMVSSVRSITENYRTLFGAMPEDSKDKIIWRGLAAFANGNFDTDPPELMRAETKKFLHLLVYCAPSGTHEQDPLQFLRSCAEICEHAKRFPMPPVLKGAEFLSFHLLCLHYHPQLKTLLTWLCEPQKHPELEIEAIEFLGKYASGVTVTPEVAGFNFDKSADDYFPAYYITRVDYKLLMGPVCKFIFDRIERYHEWLDTPRPQSKKKVTEEDEESEREKAVPIRICDRPGCGKFFVPRRVGRKKFCSDACVRQAQTPRSGDENRDYMRLYRLEKDTPAVLRKKLKSPIKKQWLDKIENDWPDLAGRVKTLKKRAGL
jgi:hypothetical protein